MALLLDLLLLLPASWRLPLVLGLGVLALLWGWRWCVTRWQR